ncbi:NAD-dependent succinate-semialdehyde dehydrogenase [Saccharopolyspora sp. K220]|uniref:NAD-dependent succinate-semialdehyde dehydrogenase n=1 Tax=Saccharopolyspora soli TaxID=2926618 RepID=UPI001F59E420|nr:NAD-dependent succinate-semialdehyde dehydrogenase [Saccharopolyspora soli]MCI2422360.1 NAD-dependent succinate-semialdehyde dehydrogenase [Saccharopolyspora soli]
MTTIDPDSIVKDVPVELFIGGIYRPSSDSARISVSDPATGAEIASVASASVQDGLDAVGAAHAAGPTWAATAPRERADVLRRAFDLMTERAEQLAALIVLENGKTLADARAEVAYAAEFFRWYSEEAVRSMGTVQTAPSGANRILVLRQPIGVSVLVTPWNFPAAMATRKIGPALAAGCTVVLKPASETPLTALAIADLLTEAGVPGGVVNVLPSSRSGSVVRAMLDDPRVRKVSFTGSTEVGRRLLASAADTVVSSSMELGGNAPFLVFADADLDSAVDIAMVAKMRNGGEACTAANRFYVERPAVAEFTQRLAAQMASLRMGHGLDADVRLGPLVNATSRDKVASLVSQTVEMGAKVVTGGAAVDGPGYFYPPTVLSDVHPDAPVLKEEIFGPVAPVVAFDTEAEAIELANATEYGLVSYVCTGDLAKGLRVAERMDSGMVGLNRGVVSDPAAPFGGTKQSGIGREGGHEGMLEFTESKYIAVEW